MGINGYSKKSIKQSQIWDKDELVYHIPIKSAPVNIKNAYYCKPKILRSSKLISKSEWLSRSY